LEAGTLLTALEGDVMRREDSGGLFLCEDSILDGPRLERFDISPTGPMPGRKMVTPVGVVADTEAEVLRDLGLDPAGFRSQTGSRRPLRVPVSGGSVQTVDSGVWLTFACPPGAFATAVVREVVGSEVGVSGR
jgi:tRNA pseudouridine13 synthase